MTIVFEDNQVKIHHDTCEQRNYTESDVLDCKAKLVSIKTKTQIEIDLMDYWISQIQSK